MEKLHAFGDALAQAIAACGGPQMKYIPDDQTIVFEDGDLKQIVNIYNFFRMHEAGRPVEDIANFIVRLGNEQKTPVDLQTARPLLHLHVVSEDYLKEQGLFRPCGPGLKAALVLDYPDFVRFLVKGDLEKIGESEDVLWAIAEVNTDAKMPEPVREQMPNGKDALVFECSMGAVYAWRYAITHGTAICGMPRRDLGFVTTDDTPESFAMLGIATVAYFREAEDHPLVPLAYRFVNGKLAGVGGAVKTSQSNAS